MIQKIEYSEGTIEVEAEFGDDTVYLRSTSKSTLMDVILSLELAGVAEEKDFDDLSIRQLGTHFIQYELIIDRPTFCMWFAFEVLNY